jgi:ketosteroid isomerase-like protein
MTMQAPDVITRYFAAADRRNIDEVVRLFSDDAVVADEDRTWRGASGVRAWREGPATAYQYTTKVQSIESAGGANYIARVRLEGNFPGGIVDLLYRFTIDDQSIRRLEIA